MHAYQYFLEQNSEARSISEAAWIAMYEMQVKDFIILIVIFSILVNKVIIV